MKKSRKALQLTIFDNGGVLITGEQPVDNSTPLVDKRDPDEEARQRKRDQQRAYRARKKAERDALAAQGRGRVG